MLALQAERWSESLVCLYPMYKIKAVHIREGDSCERAASIATSFMVVSGAKRPWGVPLFKLSLKGQLNCPMIRHLEEGSSFGNRLKARQRKEDSSKHGRMIEELDQDVAKVLADATRVHTYSRRRRAVSTGSGGVSTASRIVSTAGMIQQVNIIIPSSSATKDKEIAQRLQEEIDAAEKQRMAQVHQAAQGFTEDDWEDIRARFEADEELTQKLQAEERE
ncbi:hypothetical protein Tco_1203971 [Tanacetum coccineum]